MPIQTAEREELQQIIQSLPDEKIPAVLLFIKDFEHIPNEETIAAILEGDELARMYCSRFIEDEDTSATR